MPKTPRTFQNEKQLSSCNLYEDKKNALKNHQATNVKDAKVYLTKIKFVIQNIEKIDCWFKT